MKKWMAMLCISMLICTSAQAVTLEQMRATVPQEVTFVMENEQITVPVVMPESTHMPAVFMEMMTVDASTLAAAFGEGVQRDTGDGRIHLVLPKENEQEDLHAAFQQTMTKLNLPWDFFIHKEIENENIHAFNCALLLNGVPTYCGAGLGNYIWFSDHGGEGWELSMSYMDIPAETAWDVDFVSFNSIVQWVQQRIDGGTLKAVDGIELWYGKQRKGTDFMFTPVWRVFGFDSEWHKWRKGEIPDAWERYRRCPPYDFSIALDASTGELLTSEK